MTREEKHRVKVLALAFVCLFVVPSMLGAGILVGKHLVTEAFKRWLLATWQEWYMPTTRLYETAAEALARASSWPDVSRWLLLYDVTGTVEGFARAAGKLPESLRAVRPSN
jgi:hypothetical protein